MENTRIFAFIGGEFAPDLSQRVDLEKYSLGMSTIENFIVDFKGGIKSRPGFIYNGVAEAVSRSFSFPTGNNQSDIRVIFSPDAIHFMQDGLYLLGTSTTITNVADNILTVASHTFVAGELVYVEDTTLFPDTYRVTGVTGTTITVQLENGATPANNSVAGASPRISHLLALTTPYAAEDIPNIRYDFRLDHAEVTLNNFPPYTLATVGAGFTFAETDYTEVIDPPSITGFTPSDVGVGTAIFVVSAVDADGKESLPSYPATATLFENYTLVEGFLTVEWTAVPEAAFYRVYRSAVLNDVEIDRGRSVGLIGETRGTSFTDNNITADFTSQPRISQSPFDTESILTLNIISGGSGYDTDAVLTVTSGTGSGFIGYPIVVGGVIIGTRIIKGGTGYALSDPVSITSGGAGTGASIEIASLSPATGLNPSTTRMFQQRRYYAGFEETPITTYASKIGTEHDFSASDPLTDSDSYNITLDVNEAVPIQSMLVIDDSLLLFHSRGVERLFGPERKAVGALNRFVTTQSSYGSGSIEPVLINDNVVYVSFSGRSIFSAAYNLAKQSFTPVDRSLLAYHLFEKHKPVRTQWIDEPYKVFWVLREDGVLLSMTFLPEQEIYAWARHLTQGKIVDIVSIRDLDGEHLYATIRRIINGTVVYYHEKMHSRQMDRTEDYIGLDASISSSGEAIPESFSIQENEDGTAILTFVDAYTVGITVGATIRAGCGIYEVTQVTSSVIITALTIEPAMHREHYSNDIDVIEAGQGELWTPSSTFIGYGHLEGDTIKVLADGDVYEDLVVLNGQITLPNPATKAHGGRPYRCKAVTLPLETAQAESLGRRKNTAQLLAHLFESRGLYYGQTGTDLFEFKEGDYEDLGDTLSLKSGFYPLIPLGDYRYSQSITLQTEYPLPLSILGFVVSMEIEND